MAMVSYHLGPTTGILVSLLQLIYFIGCTIGFANTIILMHRDPSKSTSRVPKKAPHRFAFWLVHSIFSGLVFGTLLATCFPIAYLCCALPSLEGRLIHKVSLLNDEIFDISISLCAEPSPKKPTGPKETKPAIANAAETEHNITSSRERDACQQTDEQKEQSYGFEEVTGVDGTPEREILESLVDEVCQRVRQEMARRHSEETSMVEQICQSVMHRVSRRLSKEASVGDLLLRDRTGDTIRSRPEYLTRNVLSQVGTWEHQDESHHGGDQTSLSPSGSDPDTEDNLRRHRLMQGQKVIFTPSTSSDGGSWSMDN